jgi:hypothetical protein
MNIFTTPARQGMRNGLLAALYILTLAFLMYTVSPHMDDTPTWLAPAFGLLLFVVSALITGSLVLWQPIRFLIASNVRDAALSLASAAGTLLSVLIVVFVALLLR